MFASLRRAVLISAVFFVLLGLAYPLAETGIGQAFFSHQASGLTIAKTFVEAHGQRIWVEDAPGGGARFCFTLPVANVVEERELAQDSHRR